MIPVIRLLKGLFNNGYFEQTPTILEEVRTVISDYDNRKHKNRYEIKKIQTDGGPDWAIFDTSKIEDDEIISYSFSKEEAERVAKALNFAHRVKYDKF